MKNSNAPSTLLGFDYGLRHIGIAVGQTITKTAKPLCGVKATDHEPPWGQIAEIIAEWNPDALIIGLPLNMDGTEQSITHKAKSFAKELHNRFKLPIYFIDERLTTVEAKKQLFAEKGYRGLEKAAIDAVSAQIILESWMGKN